MRVGNYYERKWRFAGGLAALAALAAACSLAATAAGRSRRIRGSGLNDFRYNRRYAERIRLADGTAAVIRMVMPWDKGRLKAGMAGLSADSRYARFHAGKTKLTAAELRYFTEIDGVNHFAIGAVRENPRREGLGIARFVRFAHQPDSADAAIVIAESVRGKGLGKALFTSLIEAARERGFRTLVCEVIATNSPMLRLLDAVSPSATKVREGASIRVEIPV